MSVYKESMLNKIEDDLQGRNQNWDTLETHLADNAAHGIDTKANKGGGQFIELTLQNGWEPFISGIGGDEGVLASKNDMNIVTLVFRAKAGTVAKDTVITTLPDGFKPRGQGLVFSVFDGNGDYMGHKLQITKSGNIRVQGTVPFESEGIYTGHVLFEGD